MSHHKDIYILDENGTCKIGHVRITNHGEILSIWIRQPWGIGELFIPESGKRECSVGEEE